MNKTKQNETSTGTQNTWTSNVKQNEAIYFLCFDSVAPSGCCLFSKGERQEPNRMAKHVSTLKTSSPTTVSQEKALVPVRQEMKAESISGTLEGLLCPTDLNKCPLRPLLCVFCSFSNMIPGNTCRGSESTSLWWARNEAPDSGANRCPQSLDLLP